MTLCSQWMLKNYIRLSRKLDHDDRPTFYKRFIDDGIGSWTHGDEKLHKFMDQANKIHPNIRIEYNFSSTSLHFLDTTIRTKDGLITTDLYTKPTDRHMYHYFIIRLGLTSL